MKRRDFIKSGLILTTVPAVAFGEKEAVKRSSNPVAISTWKHGLAANESAMKVLLGEGSALDAVESGVKVSEADPEVSSVGYGGRPDENGNVTLDACIMDFKGNAGSVAFLQGIKHPVSVARKVMERTDHVMLVGEGAKRFALAHGFKEEDLLTDVSRKKWLERKEKLSDKDDWGVQDNHDTIGMLAQDSHGNLAGACTTSGLAYKIHGRVGDTPIIGAGLYVDNDVGAAAATGRGEAVIKTCGSFLVVELMRQGYTPQVACEEALKRIIRKHNNAPRFQVAYIALRKDGNFGATAIKNGFQYAWFNGSTNSLNKISGLAK